MRANSDFLSMGLQDGALIFRYLDTKRSTVKTHTKLKVRGGHAPSWKMELLQNEFGLQKNVYHGGLAQT